MNSKWYIGLLLVVLAFLGISSEQAVVPNQEIVVQFNGDAVSANETENTIAIVAKQLEAIGVKGIQVVETLDGNLKITYYSAIDVAVIKEVFAKQNNVLLEHTAIATSGTTPKLPIDNDTATYELNVSEIQTATDADMGLNGVLVDIKSGNEWYLNPVLYFKNATIDGSAHNSFENVAYTLYGNVALDTDTRSYKIPEVRAGPLS